MSIISSGVATTAFPAPANSGNIVARPAKRPANMTKYLLRGDFDQKTEQARHLTKKGVEVEQEDNFFWLKNEEDYKVALNEIWFEKLTGWMSYRQSFTVEYRICDLDDFNIASRGTRL